MKKTLNVARSAAISLALVVPYAFPISPAYAQPTCPMRVSLFCEEHWQDAWSIYGPQVFASYDECFDLRVNLDCPPPGSGGGSAGDDGWYCEYTDPRGAAYGGTGCHPL